MIEQLKKINIIVKKGLNPKYNTILKKQPEILEEIINNTSFLSPTSSIRERLYCIINEISKQPQCTHPECTNSVNFIKDGKKRNTYHKYCSLQCSNSDTKTKIKKQQTSLKNYGVDNISKSEIIKQKKINTSREKYGTDYPWQQNKKIHLLKNKKWLYQKHLTEQLTLTEIGNITGVDKSVVASYAKMHNIPIQHYFQSAGEKQVGEFISSLGYGVVLNDRTVIPPYEIDIFIPELNVAFEYNGDYWHGPDFPETQEKDKLKKKLCEEQGINLTHIWESDWNGENDIMKEIICIKMGLYQ